MRRNIDRHPERIKAVLTEASLRKTFLKGVPKSDAKTVQAFVANNADNALKTKPKTSCNIPKRVRSAVYAAEVKPPDSEENRILNRSLLLLNCEKEDGDRKHSASQEVNQRGFTSDHPEIDLLRLRNYTIGRDLSDEEVTAANILDHVASLLTCMKPFITYLNSVVMPDEAEEEDDSDEGEEDSDGSDAASASEAEDGA